MDREKVKEKKIFTLLETKQTRMSLIFICVKPLVTVGSSEPLVVRVEPKKKKKQDIRNSVVSTMTP